MGTGPSRPQDARALAVVFSRDVLLEDGSGDMTRSVQLLYQMASGLLQEHVDVFHNTVRRNRRLVRAVELTIPATEGTMKYGDLVGLAGEMAGTHTDVELAQFTFVFSLTAGADKRARREQLDSLRSGVTRVLEAANFSITRQTAVSCRGAFDQEDNSRMELLIKEQDV
jgi:hypothetical protein